jgi:hypothetical protein
VFSIGSIITIGGKWLLSTSFYSEASAACSGLYSDAGESPSVGKEASSAGAGTSGSSMWSEGICGIILMFMFIPLSSAGRFGLFFFVL